MNKKEHYIYKMRKTYERIFYFISIIYFQLNCVLSGDYIYLIYSTSLLNIF